MEVSTSLACLLIVGFIVHITQMSGYSEKQENIENGVKRGIEFEADEDTYETKVDIILSAYKHSGSTATGRILSKRIDTFYTHEPLWQIATHGFYKGPTRFCADFFRKNFRDICISIEKFCPRKRESTKGFSTFPENFVNDTYDVIKTESLYHRTLSESNAFLQSLLDCTFHRYSDFFFDPKIEASQNKNVHSIFYHGQGWNSLKRCRERNGTQLTECLKEAERSCRSAKHRVIKLLRMTLDNITPFLKSNKRLKLIHLFRDPRGILNSYLGPTWYPLDDEKLRGILGQVKLMCERFSIDLQASEMLRMLFPDRFKVIQYEHFFNSPLPDAARQLYEFAGMSYGRDQQKVIETKFGGNNKNRTTGFHPFTYRTKLPWDVINLFNRECPEVLDRLGYTRYKDNAHLRDLSKSGFASEKDLKC